MAHDTEQFPGYEILVELGRGTTGIVYEAILKSLNRRVALKALRLGSDAEFGLRARRFIREAQVLAGLTRQPDANIPTIYAVEKQHDGQPFYIRELIEGATLEQVTTLGSINLQSGLRTLSSIGDAVQRVHSLGFAHRNLHPSNVLLAAGNSPKLIGFGRCALLGEATVPRGSSRVSAEVDINALQQLVDWLCATLGLSLPARLTEARRLDSISSPAAFARVLSKCADEDLPK